MHYLRNLKVLLKAECLRCQDAKSVLQAKPRHSQWKFVDTVGETTD